MKTMRKTKTRNVRLVLFVFCTLVTQLATGNVIYFGNNHFTISQDPSFANITMDKHAWESFTIDLTAYNADENFASFNIEASDDIVLRIDGFARNQQFEMNSFNVSANDVKRIDLNLTGYDMRPGLLIVYVNPGSDYSGSIRIGDFNITGTHDFFNLGNIKAFPNPASDEIFINLPEINLDLIKIVDVNGKVIYSERVYRTSFAIDLRNFESGIYFVKAMDERLNTVATTKFIVQ